MNTIILLSVLILVLLVCVISLLLARQLEKHGYIIRRRKARRQSFCTIDVFLSEDEANEHYDITMGIVTNGHIKIWDRMFVFVRCEVVYDQVNEIYAVKTVYRKEV